MAVVVTRHRFTVDEYHRMGEVGIFTEDDRVELLEGEVVEMAPIGVGHASAVDRIAHVLSARLRDRVIVRTQGPVRLSQLTEPQPDIALLKPRPDFYARAHPGPPDVLIVVEVMDTTVKLDRLVKLPLYAKEESPKPGW